MFLHIFINRFKCYIKDKEVIIWLFIFPILLATMFKMAIPNASTFEEFEPVNIAIIDNIEYKENVAFKEAIASVSNLNGNVDTKDNLFNVKITNELEAKDMLNNNEIIGYIEMKYEPDIFVKESGLDQTILKEFVNSYLQTSSQFANILKENPEAIQNLISELGESKSYLKEVSPTDSESNNTMSYYYALIAMACLYGGSLGLMEVLNFQANQSAKGVRMSLAPINKLKLFAYSIISASVLQVLIILSLLVYLMFGLGVDFGNKIGYVILTAIVSSLTGVSFGAMIGSVVKGTESFKSGILISVTMLLSFLAGLMIGSIKYMISTNAPILAYINPANVISDAFYSLYYYNTYSRFFTNISILLVFSLVSYLIVFFKMRRLKYASI
ncbi:MAG: ABC transporter permease [Clostridia bacterium]|nr:ABC transporter permease [Clostridia bacterium]